jgi:hypothetical protein
MANTVIQLRRSVATSSPVAGSLAQGVPAYSFVSDKLFLGNSAGSGVITVGGKYYTDIVDGATSANAANNLVKRDLNGDFEGRRITALDRFIGTLFGTANAAAVLTPGRYIALTGDATANTLFDGSTNINLVVDLSDTGVAAATYGEGTTGSFIPVITVDAEGRITSAANVATPAGSSFVINGNTGTDTITSGDKLNFYGGDGMSIGVAVSSNTGNTIIVLNVDSTVVRTSGNQTIAGDKTFTGNNVFSGTTFYANTVQLNVGDNLVVLNADMPNSVAPSEDSGIVVNRGSANSNASVYWDETNDWWTAVSNNILAGASALGRIHTDSYANATALSVGTVPSARMSGSYTGITGLGTITVGDWRGSVINVQFGGTGQSSFALNGVIYGAGANGALLITAAPTEGQVLQGNVSGAPVFGMIDGGTY